MGKESRIDVIAHNVFKNLKRKSYIELQKDMEDFKTDLKTTLNDLDCDNETRDLVLLRLESETEKNTNVMWVDNGKINPKAIDVEIKKITTEKKKRKVISKDIKDEEINFKILSPEEKEFFEKEVPQLITDYFENNLDEFRNILRDNYTQEAQRELMIKALIEEGYSEEFVYSLTNEELDEIIKAQTEDGDSRKQDEAKEGFDATETSGSEIEQPLSGTSEDSSIQIIEEDSDVELNSNNPEAIQESELQFQKRPKVPSRVKKTNAKYKPAKKIDDEILRKMKVLYKKRSEGTLSEEEEKELDSLIDLSRKNLMTQKERNLSRALIRSTMERLSKEKIENIINDKKFQAEIFSESDISRAFEIGAENLDVDESFLSVDALRQKNAEILATIKNSELLNGEFNDSNNNEKKDIEATKQGEESTGEDRKRMGFSKTAVKGIVAENAKESEISKTTAKLADIHRAGVVLDEGVKDTVTPDVNETTPQNSEPDEKE